MQLKLQPKLHGDCENPCFRDVFGKDPDYEGVFVSRSSIFKDERGTISDVVPLKIGVVRKQWYEHNPVYYCQISVRCRKCDKCARHKRNLWAARARVEIAKSVRTWLLTLTLGFHARLSFGDDPKLFKREIRLMLGRIRKDLGYSSFRYLVAFERHKDGVLHAHLLLHDLHGFLPKRAIQRQWPHGHTNCKLADDKAPAYVAKYICKDMTIIGRIPASKGYGQPAPLV